jgi:hypothetical protein
MKEAYLTGPVYAKAALENIWRRIPFLDTEYYIQFIERHRIPIIQFDEEFAPPGVSFESLQLLPDRSDAATQSTSENVMLIVQFAEAFNVVLNILQALGLPRNVYIEDGDGNWFRAAHRAFEIMKRRSEV